MLSSKSMENGLLRILNDLDNAGPAGRAKNRDKEEGGTSSAASPGGNTESPWKQDRIHGHELLLKDQKSVTNGRTHPLIESLCND